MRSNDLFSLPRSTCRYFHPSRHISNLHTNLKIQLGNTEIGATIFFHPSLGSKSTIDAAPSIYGFHTTTSLKFSRWIVKSGFWSARTFVSGGAASYTRSVAPLIFTNFESSMTSWGQGVYAAGAYFASYFIVVLKAVKTIDGNVGNVLKSARSIEAEHERASMYAKAYCIQIQPFPDYKLPIHS